MKKDRGVIANVSKEYYSQMEKTRNILRSKYKIKVRSNKELTKLMTYTSPIHTNKKWITRLKKMGY